MRTPAKRVGSGSLAITSPSRLGELYLSPIGLSLVTKVAPARMLSMIMGVWMATSFTGNFLAGWFGSFWSRMEKPHFFLMIAAIAALAGVMIFPLPLAAERGAVGRRLTRSRRERPNALARCRRRVIPHAEPFTSAWP